jgi:hypothetical protein
LKKKKKKLSSWSKHAYVLAESQVYEVSMHMKCGWPWGSVFVLPCHHSWFELEKMEKEAFINALLWFLRWLWICGYYGHGWWWWKPKSMANHPNRIEWLGFFFFFKKSSLFNYDYSFKW